MLDGTPIHQAAGDCQLDLGKVQLRSASHPGGFPAVEGGALPSLPALEREVPMGLCLRQMASQDGDLGSEPLGLTFHPDPWHKNWSHQVRPENWAW